MKAHLLFCLTLNLLVSQSNIELNAKLVDVYLKHLEAFGFSGSLLISHQDKIILNQNYGQNDQSARYAYGIASLNKFYVATTILYLEQKGLLQTTDPVSIFLDYMPEDKHQLTLHQLLSHTSGLVSPYWDDVSNRELSEMQFIQKTLARDLLFKPGSRFAYSNFGYRLLIKVVEKLTGKSFQAFIRDELFMPNAISRTGPKDINWEKTRIAEYHDWTMDKTDPAFRNPLNLPEYLSKGYMLSTTEDVYKWSKLIFRTNIVLADSSRKKMMTPVLNNYAYGLELRTSIQGKQVFYHGGYDSWFGMVTGMYHFVEDDLTIIFLGNTHLDKKLRHRRLSRQIEGILFSESIMMPHSGNGGHSENLKILQGLYNTGTQSLKIVFDERRNKLKLTTTDPALIRELYFPTVQPKNRRKDAQLEYIFNQIRQNKYDTWKAFYPERSDFPKFKKTFQKRWLLFSKSRGRYTDLEILHSYYERGLLHVFIELKFEQGSMLYHCYRNASGQFDFIRYVLPRRIELYLAPQDEHTFLTFTLLEKSQSTLRFTNSTLRINGFDSELIKSD